MNKNRMIVGFILVSGTVLPAYLEYRKVREREHTKRLELASNLERDLDAIRRASLKMEEKLRDPSYRPTGVKQVFEDLEFEIIAAHLEK